MNHKSSEKAGILELKPLNLKSLERKNITQNDNTTELDLLKLDGIGSGIFINVKNKTKLNTLVSEISEDKKQNGTENNENEGERGKCRNILFGLILVLIL